MAACRVKFGDFRAGKRQKLLMWLDGCKIGLTVESEEGEVPHLRWSQAPPRPWPRPGSADIESFWLFCPEFDTEVLENVLELCDLYRDRERKKSAPSVFTL